MSHGSDPVEFFSENASEFHGLYAGASEFHERTRIWHGLLQKYATRGGLSVDMGCGPGVFTFYLAEHIGGQVVGVDGAEGMLGACEEQRKSRNLSNVRFLQARLPFFDETQLDPVNLLISSSVIEYVEDLRATLALFGRMVRPNGIAIISMPNRTSISRTYERVKYKLTGGPRAYAYIRHFSTPRTLARQCRRVGFHFLEAHYYAHVARLAKLGNELRLPAPLTEDLFVAVFRKA
jgi:ubiquinone/menaquinone biosynthesis C-methylase UbiE